MTRDAIEGLKSSVSLKSLLERDGFRLIRFGRLFKTRCPFHNEKTPSFVIYDDHFHCFGCNAHGDIFHYVMRRDGCGFKEALEKLNGGAQPIPMRTKRITHKVMEPVLPDNYFTDMLSRWIESTKAADLERLANVLGVQSMALTALHVAHTDRSGVWAFPMCDWRGKIIGIRM